ncbi:hypothetical protein GIB67_025242 [Kingdonia uniflora]|uniref:Uncharacterized protein n=1 Tax=Kingdonia uniflora TaxID=39325 RepID=A0A7J7NB84_9MAGN|nr:hypothetical protein GIB67_025242 [Kingdonia uniflora]
MPELFYSNIFLFYLNRFLVFLPEVFYLNIIYSIRIHLFYSNRNLLCSNRGAIQPISF